MTISKARATLRVAVVLLVVAGIAGGHRIYLGKRESGIFMAVMAAIAIGGLVLDRSAGFGLAYGMILLGLAGIVILDAFRLRRWVRRRNSSDETGFTPVMR